MWIFSVSNRNQLKEFNPYQIALQHRSLNESMSFCTRYEYPFLRSDGN